MKKFIVPIVIIIFNLSVSAQQFGGMDFSKAFEAGMERRADMFEVMATRTNECIEFVGGSIMEDCEWSEIFDNPKIINRGISGNTSVDILNRIDELIRHKPSKVFLETGTSDLSNGIGIDTIVNNISKITQFFHRENPDTRFYIFSILPSVPAGSGPIPGMKNVSNDDILALNIQLKSFCKKNKFTYIDLYPYFLGEDKTSLDTSLGNSNSRLSVSGYGLLKELIAEYVNE